MLIFGIIITMLVIFFFIGLGYYIFKQSFLGGMFALLMFIILGIIFIFLFLKVCTINGSFYNSEYCPIINRTISKLNVL